MSKEEIVTQLKTLCNSCSLEEAKRLHSIFKFQNEIGLIDSWVLAIFQEIYIERLTGEEIKPAVKVAAAKDPAAEEKPSKTTKLVKKSDFDAKKDNELRDSITEKMKSLTSDVDKFKKAREELKGMGVSGVKNIPEDKLLIFDQYLDKLIAAPSTAEQKANSKILDDFDVIPKKDKKEDK